MKHISQQMLSMELRRPHLRRWRRRLNRILSSPGLSDDRRRVIEREIHGVGQPKVYDADDPPTPGALQGGTRPTVHLDLQNATHETLSSVPHTTLYLYALQHDLEVATGDTKAQVVSAILNHREGEQS